LTITAADELFVLNNFYLLFCVRNLPRAIWISIPLITVIYVFANVAYFTVLTVPQLLQSSAVAVVSASCHLHPEFLMQ